MRIRIRSLQHTNCGPCFVCNAGLFVYIFLNVLTAGIIEFYFYLKTDRLHVWKKLGIGTQIEK